MIFLETLSLGNLTSEQVLQVMGFGALGAVIAGAVFFMFLFLIAIYVYSSLVLMIIAKKLKNKNAWVAWIPIVNIGLTLQLGGFHWAWAFLILIPIFGWIALFFLGIISWWRILEKRNYPAMLSLLLVLGLVPKLGALTSLAFLIVLGFVAWKDMPKQRKR